MMPSGFRRLGNFSFINQFSKKQHRLALTSLTETALKFNVIFHDSTKKNQKIKVSKI